MSDGLYEANETEEEILGHRKARFSGLISDIRALAANPATAPYQALISEQADRIEKDGHVSDLALTYFNLFLASGTPEDQEKWFRTRPEIPRPNGFTISDSSVARKLRLVGLAATLFKEVPVEAPRKYKR